MRRLRMSAGAWALTIVFLAILVAVAFALGRRGKFGGSERGD
jgi:hypothetical protein